MVTFFGGKSATKAAGKTGTGREKGSGKVCGTEREKRTGKRTEKCLFFITCAVLLLICLPVSVMAEGCISAQDCAGTRGGVSVQGSAGTPDFTKKAPVGGGSAATAGSGSAAAVGVGTQNDGGAAESGSAAAVGVGSVAIGSHSAAAVGSGTQNDGGAAESGFDAFEKFRSELPPEVASLLPEGFFGSDPEGVATAVQDAAKTSKILAFVRDCLGVSLRELLPLLAQICGVLVLSAVLGALSEHLGGGTGQAFSFCSVTVLALLVLRRSVTGVTRLRAWFDTLATLAGSMLPMMGTLYALGGNVRAAAANHGVLSVFLSVAQVLCSRAVLPVAGVCLVLALSDALTGKAVLKPLGNLIKRTFTLGISFLMLLLSFLLGLQTTLAAGSDTLALRTVRFAAGSFLPVVGGSVSEAMKTVAGSIGYLRTLAGTGGILVLFLFFLPTFLTVLLTRVVFLLAGALAELLGVKGEGRILGELASVYGYFLAVIAAVFTMAVFSLSLFAHCAVAGG